MFQERYHKGSGTKWHNVCALWEVFWLVTIQLTYEIFSRELVFIIFIMAYVLFSR